MCQRWTESVKGDLWVLVCALVFPFHIWTVNHFAPMVDGVRLSCIQFLVCGILSGICMFFTETPDIGNILQAWMPLLYAGALSCGLGYTLQIIGQKDFNPTIASLLMSFEISIFRIGRLGTFRTGIEYTGDLWLCVDFCRSYLSTDTDENRTERIETIQGGASYGIMSASESCSRYNN